MSGLDVRWTDAITADPIRILQAIIIGVSFLGAGTIFRGKRPEEVQGLTTAASLLMSSGIGIAVALQQFLLAVGVTCSLRSFFGYWADSRSASIVTSRSNNMFSDLALFTSVPALWLESPLLGSAQAVGVGGSPCVMAADEARGQRELGVLVARTHPFFRFPVVYA